MAPSRKIRRACTPETPLMWTLPADLLLDIVARFDLCTLVCCAATCRLLRRDLLSPPFVRRVSQAAQCILAYLCTDEAEKPLTLVHPPTFAALSFCHNLLSPFVSRKGVRILLDEYTPVSSRRGLVILRRRSIQEGTKSDLCVYDPMSGAQTFFSNHPKMQTFPYFDQNYVLLTASDGIGSHFRLLVFDLYECNFVTVHTGSPCGTWGPVKYLSIDKLPWRSLKKRGEPAILCGGVIHWLAYLGKQVQSYDFRTGKTGSVKLPPTECGVNNDDNKLYLATSSDGKRLKLLVIQGFIMFVWLRPQVSRVRGNSWSLETVIDMGKKMRLLDPNITGGPDDTIEFEGSGTRTGDVVFLNVIRRRSHEWTLIVFDLETREIHRQKQETSLVEIDLPSRLQSMKIFS